MKLGGKGGSQKLSNLSRATQLKWQVLKSAVYDFKDCRFPLHHSAFVVNGYVQNNHSEFLDTGDTITSVYGNH